jgi:hypothetical protein
MPDLGFRYRVSAKQLYSETQQHCFVVFVVNNTYFTHTAYLDYRVTIPGYRVTIQSYNTGLPGTLPGYYLVTNM